MRVVLDRELDLRADAVGTGNENRLSIPFRREAKQAAEAAQTADRLGSQRARDRRANALDERLASIDIDASRLVR